MIHRARHYATGASVALDVRDGRIHSLEPAEESEDLPFVAPGLLDLQINGYGGVWFSDEHLSVDRALQVLEQLRSRGISRICPTLITNSRQAISHGFATIRQACEREPWADRMVSGCHLEGPYISAEDGPRGAHPLEHVRRCDWEEFADWQRTSGNRIRLVTLAPEAEGSSEFIRRATSENVAIAIGHTGATTLQLQAAVDAGARLSTHLGNGAHATLPRHPNYIWDQLGEPRLMASLIADGHHLPASVVRSIYFAKGDANLILTCDASGLAGLGPGTYEYHGHQFEVLEDGRIVVAGQRKYLAGSGSLTPTCVAGMMRMTGCSLGQAWNMASRNPARLLGLETGRLEAGAAGELTLFTLSDSGEIVIERII